MKSTCKCRDVFGFKVTEALQYIGMLEREQALRRFVSQTSRGCVGRLLRSQEVASAVVASTFQGCNCLPQC